MLTHDRLLEVLAYAPDAGEFRWRTSVGAVKAGAIAGSCKPGEYRRIRVDGRFYRANRLALFYTTGAWPVGHVDHRDHDRSNDRIDNLRDVTQSVNMHNRRGAQNNSATRVLGVCPHQGRYRAQLRVRGRRINLGCYDTIEQASDAYRAAKLEHAADSG